MAVIEKHQRCLLAAIDYLLAHHALAPRSAGGTSRTPTLSALPPLVLARTAVAEVVRVLCLRLVKHSTNDDGEVHAQRH